MNCEQLRQCLQTSEGQADAELAAHLDDCPACRQWLEAELASPPAGFDPSPLDLPSPRLREAVLEAALSKPQAWWTALARALVHPLAVAGAAAMLLIAIHFSRPSSPPVAPSGRPASHLAHVTFLEPWESIVTDDVDIDTQEWSFLDAQETAISFLDDEEKEKEDTWLEESRG
ncbi:MAG: hypothetical protein OZSIB_3209 [Candidatus Ozemobacter sibiricus]|uniref:Zinc-finger domain-containing protein n=1 Tax=Candidatus Ozemobacter sibiricus TaxID=2268124 RepID=A0A367ZQS6_9BACT|nr:MAG: hypothetical protein OZSIB_3209 [Candidatus Ozemobacter sibiricus]